MILRFRFILAAFAALSLVASPAMAQTGNDQVADRVEEDWRVVIGDPDPDSTGPQITTCMSPVSGSSAFVAFCLNYRDVTDWKPGGLQIKAYGEPASTTQDRPLIASATAHSESLETDGETVTWTQRIRVSAGYMSYAVHNGASTTWGSFGLEQGNLVVIFPTSASDLGKYSPADSVALSAAGWQANRVTSMTLLRVRYYQGSTLLSTDDTPRAVTLASSASETAP